MNRKTELLEIALYDLKSLASHSSSQAKRVYELCKDIEDELANDSMKSLNDEQEVIVK